MPESSITAEVVTLAINGRETGARTNETIMDAAAEMGIALPALCHISGLSDVGSCRLCMVEIEGNPRPQPACVTRVQEGMQVRTHTPKLQQYRREILEMLFAERNHVCAVCVSNGNCDLQDLAVECGMQCVSLPYLSPQLALDASHPRFVLDPNRCILCTRCVRVCDEIEGAHTWDVSGRGVDARVVTDLGAPWGESDTCTGCGKCVHVCPTGALFEKGVSVAEMKKRRQFLPYLTVMREVRK